ELVGFPELKYGLQRSAFSHWIVGQALKADCVIAASEYARRLIPQAGYDVPEERVRVIPLGVDAGLFRPLTPHPPLPRKRGEGEQVALTPNQSAITPNPSASGRGKVRLIHVASLV